METKNHSKRTAPYQISNWTIKQPRLTEPPNARKDNKTITKNIMHDHTYYTIKRLDKIEIEKINDTVILEDRLGERLSVIRLNDFKMLNTNEYINDILIEFYLNYWYNEKLSNFNKKRTYVFSTYFYTTLAKSFNASDYPAHYTQSKIRHEKVKRWTKKIDVFQKDFLFIPINEKNHWFMAVICFPYLSGKVNMEDGNPVNQPDDLPAGQYQGLQKKTFCEGRNEADPNVEDLRLFNMTLTENNEQNKNNCEGDKKEKKKVKRPCILVLDSLSGGVRRARITATLRGWLEEEYRVKHPNGKIKDFSPEAIKGALLRLPQQPNLTDCGLFMIHYFKMFFESPIEDYNFPIRHLENWFDINDVVENSKKRKEVANLIKSKMKNNKKYLPNGIKLPFLDFE